MKCVYIYIYIICYNTKQVYESNIETVGRGSCVSVELAGQSVGSLMSEATDEHLNASCHIWPWSAGRTRCPPATARHGGDERGHPAGL